METRITTTGSGQNRRVESTRLSTDRFYRCYDADENELFIIKGEKKFSELAHAGVIPVSVKFLIETMPVGIYQNQTIGTIVYKKGRYVIDLPEHSAWHYVHRLMVLMVANFVHEDLDLVAKIY